jgi:hypothetical protein
MERAGMKVDFTYQANPGEVWEENEFWIQLSAIDGSRWFARGSSHFESHIALARSSPSKNTIAGFSRTPCLVFPKPPRKKDLTPLAYMRKYGVFEVKKENYSPFEKGLAHW